MAGESLDLTCNATGRPDPIIEWSRLGGTLLPIGQEKYRVGGISSATLIPNHQNNQFLK